MKIFVKRYSTAPHVIGGVNEEYGPFYTVEDATEFLDIKAPPGEYFIYTRFASATKYEDGSLQLRRS